MARRPFEQTFRQRIVRQYMVRFHMSLLLAGTVASGVVWSKLLLMAGLHSVLFRYPLALLGAYLVFAGLTRLWVAYVLNNAVAARGHCGMDLASNLLPGGGSSTSSEGDFGGGDSGGAGASDVWDSSPSQLISASTSRGSGGGGFRFPSTDLDWDLGDAVGVLILLASLILAIGWAGGYLSWAAPEILPDLALSTLLTSSLTRAAKRAETRGYLLSMVRATFVPLLLILGITIALAVAVDWHCPGADKLSTALACPAGMRPPGDTRSRDDDGDGRTCCEAKQLEFVAAQ